MADIDLIALPVAELAEIAHAKAIRFHLDPTDPMRAIVHPHRDPAMLPLVTALRNRREEVAAFLMRHRPPRPAISEMEAVYRCVVLQETDDALPLSEMPFGALRAIIAGIVLDALEMERGAQEWERATDGRDAEPVHPRPPTRPTPRTDGPRPIEFRGGKVVAR